MNKKIGLILCAVAFATGAMAAETLWNGLGDGTNWTDAANWVGAVPSAGDGGVIESNVDITLGGALHRTDLLTIGAESSKTVTITNGSLRVDKNIKLAGGQNSDVTLDLVDLLHTSLGNDLKIAIDNSNGSGTINVSASGGETISFDDVQMAQKTDTYAEFNAAGKTVILDNSLQLATGKGSTAKLIVDDLTVTTGGNGIKLGTGNDSSATVTYNTGSITLGNGEDLLVGTGDGSTVVLSGAIGLAGSIGNFGVGTSATDATADLINQANSTGTLAIARSVSITNAAFSHIVTGIEINDTLTVSDGAAITIIGGKKFAAGTHAGKTGSLDTADYGLVVGGALESNSDLVMGNAEAANGKIVHTNGTFTLTAGRNIKVGSATDAIGEGIFTSLTSENSGKSISIGTGIGSQGTLTLGTGTIVGNQINIGTGSNAVGSAVVDTFNLTANVLKIGSTNTGFNATGSLTVEDGVLTVGDVLVGGGSTLALNDGYLTVTNMEMGAGSELIIGAGELLWTDADVIADMGLWATDGLVSTNDGFGQAVTSFTDVGLDGEVYGTGDTRLFIDMVGADTKMWVETIPEPATIGMMMLVGGGLLFIRRRTMS